KDPRHPTQLNPQLGINQQEVEYHDPGLPVGFEAFHFGPSGGPTFMYNDTFDTAEFLGTIPSSELGRAGVVRVDGLLQKTTTLQDNADYYGVSLMAGQTITVRVRERAQLFNGAPTVDVNGDG